MTFTLAHKIALDPTVKQANYFRRAAGVARFTWNWGLDAWKKQYALGEKPSGLGLKKQFNALKMGFYEFRRQVEYKAKLRGNKVTVVDRWFPSSKRCSGCGEVKKSLSLSDRQFHCEYCHLSLDRDANAARNLFYTASSAEFQACGEVSAGTFQMKRVKLPSVKQEPDRV